MISVFNREKIGAGELIVALQSVPFDLLVMYEHARDDDGQRLACARIVADRKGRQIAWSQRWQPVAPAASDWCRSERPWIDAIDKIDSARLDVADRETIQLLGAHRIRSVMALPLLSEGKIVASILAGSCKRAAYREPQLRALRATAITELLERLLDQVQESRAALIATVRQQFRCDLSPDELAAKLVAILAAELEWDFVGIYRVEDQFTLVASCDRTPNQSLQVYPDYRQDLDVGMLGATLQAGKCLLADDVTTNPPPHNYSAIEGFNAKSALCYPIRVAGNIEWLLDCSSIAFAAFKGPDRRLLDELVEGLQSVLGLWFETRLSHAILDGLTEPVLVIDRKGVVRRANAAAANLLGTGGESGWRPRPLQELAADEETSLKFELIGSMQGEDVTITTEAFGPRKMLASSHLSSETFGHYVLKLSSRNEPQWLAGLEFARTALETEVGQSRAVLMLAGALLGRARAALQSADPVRGVDDVLDRVATLLNDADLNYDKFAASLLGKRNSGLAVRILDIIEKSKLLPLENAALQDDNSTLSHESWVERISTSLIQAPFIGPSEPS